MPDTFIKIASVTVGAGGSASISFTSIPATYTDLVVKVSTRNTGGSTGNFANYTLNSTTPTGRVLYGNGASAASDSSQYAHIDTGGGATASTFANSEIYIPNYAGSNNKSFSVDGVAENNGTTGFDVLAAGLASTTAAITSVTISPQSGSYAQYSTAVLYGIKSS